MKSNQLNRILKLVRRTGDRFVIMDQETDDVLVVMRLNEYEDLLNETASLEELEEEDMLNRLDHEIKSWHQKKEQQPISDWDEEVPPKGNLEKITTMPVIDEPMPEKSFEEVIDEEPEEINYETPTAVEPIVTTPIKEENYFEPKEVKFEEDLSDIADDGLTAEGEEPKFYLEPVE